MQSDIINHREYRHGGTTGAVAAVPDRFCPFSVRRGHRQVTGSSLRPANNKDPRNAGSDKPLPKTAQEAS